MAILNLNHVIRFQLASKTSQPHAMIAHVKRMRQIALLISTCSSDQFHWRNDSGSLLPPLALINRGNLNSVPFDGTISSAVTRLEAYAT